MLIVVSCRVWRRWWTRSRGRRARSCSAPPPPSSCRTPGTGRGPSPAPARPTQVLSNTGHRVVSNTRARLQARLGASRASLGSPSPRGTPRWTATSTRTGCPRLRSSSARCCSCSHSHSALYLPAISPKYPVIFTNINIFIFGSICHVLTFYYRI